jgi:hypothetical protein
MRYKNSSSNFLSSGIIFWFALNLILRLKMIEIFQIMEEKYLQFRNILTYDQNYPHEGFEMFEKTNFKFSFSDFTIIYWLYARKRWSRLELMTRFLNFVVWIFPLRFLISFIDDSFIKIILAHFTFLLFKSNIIVKSNIIHCYLWLLSVKII